MDYWLKVRNVYGRDVYVNMDLVITITFLGASGSERAEITFVGGEWVTTENPDDVAMLRDWAERQ